MVAQVVNTETEEVERLQSDQKLWGENYDMKLKEILFHRKRHLWNYIHDQWVYDDIYIPCAGAYN